MHIATPMVVLLACTVLIATVASCTRSGGADSEVQTAMRFAELYGDVEDDDPIEDDPIEDDPEEDDPIEDAEDDTDPMGLEGFQGDEYCPAP